MKFDIQPVSLPLGLDTADKCEIRVTYSIGDNDVDLHLYFYNSNSPLNISPVQVAVPHDVLESWQLDFSQVRAWALHQVGAQLPEP
jgi:hypothetical protein